MIKDDILNKDPTIMKIYVPNYIASIFIKQK